MDDSEIDKVRQHFDRCDENEDGKLAEDECPNDWDEGQFDHVDKDGNGEVSWEELEDAYITVHTAMKYDTRTSLALTSETGNITSIEEEDRGKSKID